MLYNYCDNMKIKDIRKGMNNVSAEGTITEISEVKEVETRYGTKNVANATLRDETGEIKLSLWDKQIDSVKVGEKISVSGAYVSEFRGELQLNIPRSGKIEKIK